MMHYCLIQKNILIESLNILLIRFPGKFYTPNGLHVKFLTARTAGLMKKANFCDIRLSLETCVEELMSERGAKTDCAEFEKSMEILYKNGSTAII